ncbi:MAG: hypothetical protein EU530_11805 [Promethearchaeota archaeon]|nr:MAG: hypothetical protein EU530_11805 [Candidatus Lokiarchaeota archaeon]
MVLTAAFIVPHGALILDALQSHRDGRYELNQAMIQVGNQIAELRPEIIMITSPHGISLSDNFGIYFNESAHGTAEWEGEYQDYQIDVKIDIDFAGELFTNLEAKKQPVSKITAFSRGVPIPMRWGESVPLWFLKNIPDMKYVFLSQPQKRYDPSASFMFETKELGKNIFEFINTHNKRIVVLVSADLAHTHQKKGPYGFYEYAEVVDKLLEEWMTAPNSSKQAVDSYDLIKKALCCGYTGFLLLQGILGDKDLEVEVLSRRTPTYYGMMVMSFRLRN